MPEHQALPDIVVGIDGSRTAIDAALWAVDDAVSRGIPLRLVCVVAPANTAPSGIHDVRTAERALREAIAAVESADETVKIEHEIVHGEPVHALKTACRGSAMLCVGAAGLAHSGRGRIGSTAAALAATAQCPVAIITAHHPPPLDGGWVVAEINESPARETTLRRATEEALLRHARLCVVTTWLSRYTDIHDNHAVADGNRLAKARLDRRLSDWRRRYPDLDVQAVAAHGSFVNYLARESGSIQLVVVAHDRANGIGELVGPPGRGALRDTNCGILICEPQNVL
ncbi:universal stress protein [Mycolicibacterium sp. CR10]|uniref:universal stress protein n=1 Tax=Mycolicibacterium sp. CR10 TaxID=2562314 RepID=UPI0010BFAE5F|nr:universal stress protein [Mycolicibacterium sp. CR10]